MNLENKVIHFARPLDIRDLNDFFSYLARETNEEIKYEAKYKPSAIEEEGKRKIQVNIEGQFNSGSNLTFHLGHMMNGKMKIDYDLFERMTFYDYERINPIQLQKIDQMRTIVNEYFERK